MFLTREEEAIFRLFYEKAIVTEENLGSLCANQAELNILRIKSSVAKGEDGTYRLLDVERYARYKKMRDEGRDEIFILPKVIQKLFDIMMMENASVGAALQNERFTKKDFAEALESGLLEKVNNIWVMDTSTYDEYERYKHLASCCPTLSSDEALNRHMDYLYIIYDYLIKGGILTSKSFKSLKITKEEVESLLKDGLLVLQSDGTYQITNYRHLYIYGNYLADNGQGDKARVCFDICHKLDETRSMFKLFYNSLLLGKFTVALEHLSFFEKTRGSMYKGDYNFYLMLLSNSIKLPNNLYKSVKAFELSDVASSYIPQEVVRCLYEGKFARGINYINEHYAESIPRELAIIRRMFTEILEHKRSFKSNVINYINENNIVGLYILLKDEDEKHYLNSTFKYMLMILIDVFKMNSSHEIVAEKPYTKETLSEFIKTKNYIKAFLLAIELAHKKGIKREDNHIGVVLEAAVRTIFICGGSLDEIVNRIITLIDGKEMSLALRTIKEYLYIHRKTSYYPFISTLIDSESVTSEDVIDLLKDITDYKKISFKKYAEAVNSALQEKNLSKAIGYQGILKTLLHHGRISALNFENIDAMAKIEVRIEEEKKYIILPTEQ